MSTHQPFGVSHVRDDLQALKNLLEHEFEALKNRQVTELDHLERAKTEALSRLQAHADSFNQAENLSSEWVEARDDLRICRDMHFRNIQLLRRQLDAVQGALQTLAGGLEGPSQIYDKSGQVDRLSRMRIYQAA